MSTRLLALFTALALAVSACSDSSDDGDAAPEGADAPTTTVAPPATGAGDGASDGSGTAFGDVIGTLATESARFEGTMRMAGSAGSQLEQAVEVPVTGELDPSEDASRISMDMGAVAQAALGGGQEMPPGFDALFEEPFEIIAIGDQSWMRFGLLGMVAGVDTDWVEISADQTGELTSGLGLGSNITSPTALLEQLQEADAELEEIGTETIRGQETTHYRAEIDVRELAEQLPESEQAELESGLGATEGPLPVELWVGEDQRLYRYTVDIGGGDGAEGESARLEFEFFDYGAEIDIQPPPPEEVTPMSELDGVLGGALGGGGTEASTEGG